MTATALDVYWTSVDVLRSEPHNVNIFPQKSCRLSAGWELVTLIIPNLKAVCEICEDIRAGYVQRPAPQVRRSLSALGFGVSRESEGGSEDETLKFFVPARSDIMVAALGYRVLERVPAAGHGVAPAARGPARVIVGDGAAIARGATHVRYTTLKNMEVKQTRREIKLPYMRHMKMLLRK
ncbi:hypothetical protein EVAR_9583_1 [Eumeta japonica]|uniref:Uncharacterized protein n=1 Tax=Eumeta variegata TaxID=151549 RepID=A0A4C1TJH6_EUMVA|nr:hypothetical protein EVAR_9583_1 [Eumeta japonica]